MYILRASIGRRGFHLEKAGQRLFQTKHKFGVARNSSVALGNDTIVIASQNLMGSKFAIRKNGYETGVIDMTSYLHSTITLKRHDGGSDILKIAEEGFSQSYRLSLSNEAILKFKKSLNPLNIAEVMTVEVLSGSFPPAAIEELIFYSGEILFRQLAMTSNGPM